MVIQMDINRRCLTHNGFDCHEIFIHPAKILLLVPHIAVHLFFKGFKLVNVQFLFRLGDGLRHLGITADVDLLCVVRAAGKGRVDVDQIDLNTTLFQIGTGGDTLASNDHVAIGVFADGFLFFHLVQGHSPLEYHGGVVRALVFEDTVEVAQDGLALNGFRDERNVFNRHYVWPPLLKIEFATPSAAAVINAVDIVLIVSKISGMPLLAMVSLVFFQMELSRILSK